MWATVSYADFFSCPPTGILLVLRYKVIYITVYATGDFVTLSSGREAMSITSLVKNFKILNIFIVWEFLGI